MVMLQHSNPDPWKVKMAYHKCAVVDNRDQSPYRMIHPMQTKTRKTAGYVLLAWVAVLAVCTIALYQGLQCFRSWKETLSQILLADPDGDLADNESSRKHLEEMLHEWNDHHIAYDYFSIRQPQFVDPADVALFGRNPDNKLVLAGPRADELIGRIHVIRNGTVHRDYDCGWKMDPSILTNKVKGRIRKKFTVLLPLLVPQSNSFQHFLDGVIPKLVQVAPLLSSVPNVTVMIYRPWDRVIETILDKFGLTEDRVYFHENGYYRADYLINTCVTPPVHPQLWHDARARLGGHLKLSVSPSKAHVILLTRAKSRNIGRKIKNMEFVQHMLKKRYGDRLQVFAGGYSLEEAVEMFGKTRMVIGVHGGAFYNMFLCPPGTNIIEIIPTLDNGTFVPEGMAFNIIWKMANLLGQHYWRLSEKPVSKYGDVLIDTDKLNKALDEADKKHEL